MKVVHTAIIIWPIEINKKNKRKTLPSHWITEQTFITLIWARETLTTVIMKSIIALTTMIGEVTKITICYVTNNFFVIVFDVGRAVGKYKIY